VEWQSVSRTLTPTVNLKHLFRPNAPRNTKYTNNFQIIIV
jgi:hypothetical protein